MDGWGIVTIFDIVAREATLFAAVGFLIGGIDDLAVDAVFLIRLYRRHRAGVSFKPAPAQPAQRRLAIFVPAWDEAAVIGAMLRHSLRIIDHPNYRIYVGTYPNDPTTRAAVDGVGDPRIHHVVGPAAGPTTKGDNLNNLWRALRADEEGGSWYADAVVLHDAEDVVHAGELRIFDRLLDTHAVVQLPVLPLISRGAPWISGHYADEFAEAHGKLMGVRQAVGAGMPLAGVGCAISRYALEAVAAVRGGAPFDPTSLTEDYEIGLRIAEMGGSGCFARVRDRERGGLVAVRSFFPATVQAAVAQKARWMNGIALVGWDRIGWSGWHHIGDHWMRMRDRRAPLAVLMLAAAYTALTCLVVSWAWRLTFGGDPLPWSAAMRALLAFNALLLLWRMAMRGFCTAHAYGWREGMFAVPRTVVANLIAMLAAWRAVMRYIGMLRGAPPVWEKTGHAFPENPAACQ